MPNTRLWTFGILQDNRTVHSCVSDQGPVNISKTNRTVARNDLGK